MPTPLTWRNVTINDGSRSAALGNTARGFGDSAIRGFSIFSDQMQDQIDREDKLLTNEAIAAALSGGPRVSGNRRVDATALQNIVRQENIDASNLKTAGLEQEGLVTSNAQALLDYAQDPILFDEEREINKAELTESRSANERNVFNLGRDRINAANTDEDRKILEGNRADVKSLDKMMVDIEARRTDELLTEAYNSGELTPGTQPTQAQWDDFTKKARAYAQGRSGRSIAARTFRDRPEGWNQAAWDASTYGAGDARAAALEDQQTALQRAAYEEDKKRYGQFEADMRWGNFSDAMAGPDGSLVPITPEQKNSIAKTYDKAITYLGNADLPVDKYGDKEKEAIEKVIDVFPHPSIFVPIVESFTVNGRLDTRKLVAAVRDGGQAALDAAKISRGRQRRDFSIGRPGGEQVPVMQSTDPTDRLGAAFDSGDSNEMIRAMIAAGVK